MIPRARGALSVAAAVLLAGSVGLAVLAFGTPVETTRTVTDLAAEVETSFVHSVLPLPSALYPEPRPLENEPFFYMRLLDELRLRVNSVLTVRPGALGEGSAEILVRVVAPERWERTFILMEARPFRMSSPSDRYTVLDEEFPIDLTQYREFIALVEEETRVMPRADYQIVVVPVVEFRVWAEGGGEGGGADGSRVEVADRFEFPYTFELAGNTLIPQGQLEQRRSAAATHMVTEPGAVRLLGASFGVVPARIAAAAAIALSAAVGAVLFWLRQREARLRPEAERIRRRYRSRLLTVRSEERAVVTGNVLELASFQDLLRVADQQEQSILMIPGEDACRFAVVGEGVTYLYEAAGNPRKSPEAAD